MNDHVYSRLLPHGAILTLEANYTTDSALLEYLLASSIDAERLMREYVYYLESGLWPSDILLAAKTNSPLDIVLLLPGETGHDKFWNWVHRKLTACNQDGTSILACEFMEVWAALPHDLRTSDWQASLSTYCLARKLTTLSHQEVMACVCRGLTCEEIQALPSAF